MHSPYRTLQSSNTQTSKRKSSNHTELDFKMTSIDLKKTSKGLKETKKHFKSNRKSKLKGGMLNDDNSTQGTKFLEQVFSFQ